MIQAENGFYYLFDPRGRNISGFHVSNGSAILLSFMLLTTLQTYLTSLDVDLNARIFELTPVYNRADIQPCEMQAGFAKQGKKN